MTEPAVCGPGLSDSKAEAAASPARPAAAALGGSRRGRGSTCAPAPPARHRLELQVTTRGCPRAGLLFLPREAHFREFDRKPRAPCRLLRPHPPRVPVWLLGPRGCCFDVTCLTCGRSRVKPPPPGSHTQQRAPNPCQRPRWATCRRRAAVVAQSTRPRPTGQRSPSLLAAAWL